jgi:hypothetical protein
MSIIRSESAHPPRVYHFARKIRADGAVSPWCAKSPRAINLAKASWTNRIEAVTCEKCIAAYNASWMINEDFPSHG